MMGETSVNTDSGHIQGSNSLVRASLPVLTLLLATIALLLMAVDTQHGQQVAIAALLMETILPVLTLRRAQGHSLTSPTFLYPFVYALFCISPVVLHAIGGPDAFGILRDSGYDQFLRLALVGLVGFQLGNYVFSTRKSTSSRLPLIGFSGTQRSVLRAGCVVATVLLLVYTAMTGGGFAQLFVGGYGKQQPMLYGLVYYVQLAAAFLFTAAFSELIAGDLLVHRRLTRATLFLAIPYLALTVLFGGRAQLLTNCVAGLVMWDLRAGRSRRRNAAIVLFVVVLVLASGIVVTIRGISASGLRATLEQQFGRSGTVAVTSAVTRLAEDFQAPIFATIWTIKSVPQDINYLYGKTLASLVFPSFISKRWGSSAKSATTFFDESYIPFTSNHGYAYTIMADGYLNFGYAGTFVYMAIIGYMLGWLERLASSSASPFLLGVYGVFYSSSLWVLRADMTSWVKGILFPVAAAWLLVFVLPSLVRGGGNTALGVAGQIKQSNRP